MTHDEIWKHIQENDCSIEAMKEVILPEGLWPSDDDDLMRNNEIRVNVRDKDGAIHSIPLHMYMIFMMLHYGGVMMGSDLFENYNSKIIDILQSMSESLSATSDLRERVDQLNQVVNRKTRKSPWENIGKGWLPISEK